MSAKSATAETNSSPDSNFALGTFITLLPLPFGKVGSSDKEKIRSLPIFDTATIKLCLSSTFMAFNILAPLWGPHKCFA